MINTFPGSSMVERSAVNRNVTGSNPVRGARLDKSPIFYVDERF